MNRRPISFVLLITFAATVLLSSSAAAQVSCGSLANLALPNVTITSASEPQVPFDMVGYAEGNLLAFPGLFDSFTMSTPLCRVQAVANPTSDSVIHIEVWLPTTGWNGRFLAIGGGGTRAGIAYNEMAQLIGFGFATAATDGGNLGNSVDGHFGYQHPEKIADWAYRSTHLMTVTAKTVASSFFGQGPVHSYFAGCSTGGHEGVMEAQRFPGDYDGIMAGAPSNHATHLQAGHIWTWNATNIDPASFIPPTLLPTITAAAVARCDAIDGVVDGLITDPRQCDFDPSDIECQGPNGTNCLTSAQVTAVKKIYAGPRNPQTGALVYAGFAPGGEFGWDPLVYGLPGSLETPPEPGYVPAFIDIIRIWAFQNPQYDWRLFDFAQDMASVDTAIASVINDVDPDLTAFKNLGGKLVLYHGWEDQHISPQDDINYYERIAAFMRSRGADAHQFARLFMVPGMQHCFGGPGPNSFDAFGAVFQWVEAGVAPEKIIATKYVNDDPSQAVVMTRPLCPHPQIAVYTGSGNTNDAASFVCRVPGNQ
jgi:feruloyl esterase